MCVKKTAQNLKLLNGVRHIHYMTNYGKKMFAINTIKSFKELIF